MSQSMATTRPRVAASTTHAGRLTAFLVLLLGLIGFGPVQPASAAPATVTKADLCSAWSEAGTASPEVDLASGLTVTGTAAKRSGSSCSASNAAVQLTGAEITKSGPQSGGNAASQALAAVTQVAAGSSGLKAGDEVFKGATLTSINAALKLGYFEINGEVAVHFSGGTVSRFLFRGKLLGLDKYTMTLSSPAGGTTLPNITGSPVTFSGTYARSGSVQSLRATGSTASLLLASGDQQISVTDASLDLGLTDDPAPHLQLDVAGTVGVGSIVRAKGTVTADFDTAGLASVSGTGDLTAPIPAKGNGPAGTITGNAKFAYTRDPLVRSVTFTGQVEYGDALVANAQGVLDGQSATFSGNVSLSDGDVVASGTVHGLAYYGDDLAGRTITNKAGQQVQATKGDVYVDTASASLAAKNLNVTGALVIGSVGGDVWASGGGDVAITIPKAGQADTVVTGTATIGWSKGGDTTVGFNGSIASGTTTVGTVSGTADGSKITFTGDLSAPTVSGKATGVVYYGGDLQGERIAGRDGDDVTPTRGDYRVSVTDGRATLGQVLATGTLSVSKVGPDTWVETAAQLKVSQSWLTFAGVIESNGDFSLKGAGQVNFDGYQVAFKGTAVRQAGKLVINGGGTFKTGLFTANLTGTVEKADATSSVYVLTGQAEFAFAGYKVAGGTVRLTLGEGMTVTFSVKACVLFICQNGTYKLYFNTDGSVNRAELNAPLTSVPLFLGIGQKALGSKVKIATKITGIV